MSGYLLSIIQPLLAEPGKLKVTESTDQMGVLLAVDLSQKDMGNVIGKSGEGAKAIRHLMRVYGYKIQARIAVKFNEPEGSRFIRNEFAAARP